MMSVEIIVAIFGLLYAFCPMVFVIGLFLSFVS